MAAAVMAGIIALPLTVQRPRIDRWFVPGRLGEETGDVGRWTADSRRGTVDGGQGTADGRRRTVNSEAVGGVAAGDDAVKRLNGEAVKRSRGFETRYMYGLRSEAAKRWGQRSQLTEPVAFSHNLNAIFPPSEYLWHPEFFPLVEGERLQPPRGSYFWQPDLGREDVAAWAAEAAGSHFQAHPNAASFAVGVNDGLIFGESEETMALVRAPAGETVKRLSGETVQTDSPNSADEGPDTSGRAVRAPTASPSHRATVSPVRWFRERPDFTDLVYTFTNGVAREVARTHPDKYVGALAYYWCENAPSFPLEPNVIPFLTADRSQGYDEQFREEERKLQWKWARAHGKAESLGKRWTVPPRPRLRRKGDSRREPVAATLNTQHSALNSDEPPLPRRLGLYDYLYGSGFLIPRVHPRLIADNLRQASRLGFTDYFAELNPNWGLDGPMAWMVAQLLQDPEQSCEVLLEEYYSRYFRDAAVPMRRFFERCEYQWMTQPGPAYWLKHYRNESQARLFPPAVRRELRALLNEAARQASDEITKKRVRFVSDTFGVTERFVAFCEARDALNRAVLRATRAVSPELSAESRESRLPTEHTTHTEAKPDDGRKEAQKVQEHQTGATDNADEHGLALGTTAIAAASSFGGPTGDKTEGGQLSALTSRFLEARAEFVTYTMELMEREPLALSPFVWADYLRHEPPLLRSVGREGANGVRQRGEGHADFVAKAMETPVPAAGMSQPQAFNLPAARRVKPFTEFRDLTAAPIVPAWTIGGLRYGVPLPEGWQSYVEPSQFQSAELCDGVLRLTGNKETFVYQWLPASAGATYRTWVQVRGFVQPSTTVILALSWLDSGQRRLGSKVHRLPEGRWPEWATLEVTGTAPAGAAWIGIGLRVQNQMGEDWLDAKGFRLEKSESRKRKPEIGGQQQ